MSMFLVIILFYLIIFEKYDTKSISAYVFISINKKKEGNIYIII